MTEGQIYKMTTSELWANRHEIKTNLRQELTERQMNAVDDLLTIELAIERKENSQKWFWQR